MVSVCLLVFDVVPTVVYGKARAETWGKSCCFVCRARTLLRDDGESLAVNI